MAVKRKRKKKKMNKSIPPVFTQKMREKILVLFLGVFFILAGLGFAIIKINGTKGDEYTVQVLAQQNYSSTVLPYKRGDIIDRNGVTLATSIKVYNLILDPKLILSDEDFLQPTLDALNECFGYDKQELTNLIYEKKDRSYYVYQKKLSYEQIKTFLDNLNDSDNKAYKNVKGVTFEDEYERKYPFSTLANGVVGFIYPGNVGANGIEWYYNDELNGIDGRQYGYVDSDNIMQQVRKEATDGNNVISTIDFNIQTIVEKYVAEWKAKYTPENIGVIVMNPNNGEVLAMADQYGYDLNNTRNLESYTEEEFQKILGLVKKEQPKKEILPEQEEQAVLDYIWRNYCVTNTYEPGSTFKPFTVACALEEGLISQTDTYLCDGKEYFPNVSRPISCHKRAGHGVISLSEALAFSCNDAMMAIAAKEGGDLLVSYQTRFGFGSRTGIDLPAETSCAGLLYNPADMVPTDLAVCSFGQGFNVTMIQLAAGFSSLINGGYYYEPHVVSQILKSNGSIVENIKPVVIRQTVTKETSDFLKVGLRQCVTIGTGKSAAVSGYQVSGKTGTAQKIPRTENKYILSFIGFAPYENPEVVCYVLVDNPQGDDSSVVTGSLYRAIMTEVLPYLNVEQDGPVLDEQGHEVQPGAEGETPAQPETGAEGETPAQPETGAEGETPAQEETTVSNIGEPEVAGNNIDGNEPET